MHPMLIWSTDHIYFQSSNAMFANTKLEIIICQQRKFLSPYLFQIFSNSSMVGQFFQNDIGMGQEFRIHISFRVFQKFDVFKVLTDNLLIQIDL